MKKIKGLPRFNVDFLNHICQNTHTPHTFQLQNLYKNMDDAIDTINAATTAIVSAENQQQHQSSSSSSSLQDLKGLLKVSLRGGFVDEFCAVMVVCLSLIWCVDTHTNDDGVSLSFLMTECKEQRRGRIRQIMKKMDRDVAVEKWTEMWHVVSNAVESKMKGRGLDAEMGLNGGDFGAKIAAKNGWKEMVVEKSIALDNTLIIGIVFIRLLLKFKTVAMMMSECLGMLSVRLCKNKDGVDYSKHEKKSISDTKMCCMYAMMLITSHLKAPYIISNICYDHSVKDQESIVSQRISSEEGCLILTSSLGVVKRCFLHKIGKDKYENVAGSLVLKEIFGVGFNGHFWAAKRMVEEFGSLFMLLQSSSVKLESENHENNLSSEVASEISYNIDAPKNGWDCARHIVTQNPHSFAAWNCYYIATSRIAEGGFVTFSSLEAAVSALNVCLICRDIPTLKSEAFRCSVEIVSEI
ncbi:hypothetical protein Tco_0971782 [Tanacetum coccineum]